MALQIPVIVQEVIQALQQARTQAVPSSGAKPEAVDMQQILGGDRDTFEDRKRAELYFEGWSFGPVGLRIKADTDGQSASPGTAVAKPPAVEAFDSDGKPVVGIHVHFAVAKGEGRVVGDRPQTNADGVAAVDSWTLGTAVGENALVAEILGSTVTFRANATAPPVIG